MDIIYSYCYNSVIMVPGFADGRRALAAGRGPGQSAECAAAATIARPPAYQWNLNAARTRNLKLEITGKTLPPVRVTCTPGPGPGPLPRSVATT